ncbi:nucleotide pyrophosphohydrolase domain protein [Shewanella phage S0112]|nr:nucleotide pyrophosphohydrolase domain protein [Shewanella phage S0112]
MSNIFESHGQMVSALAKPGAEVVAGLTATSAHLLHMAVGISGEVAELLEAFTPENIQEELGDIFFYVEGIYQGVPFGREFSIPDDIRPPMLGKTEIACFDALLASKAGKILDLVKKHAIYQKPLDAPGLQAALSEFERVLGGFVAHHTTLTPARLKQGNMEKLSKRYSSGSYSNTQAQTRADKPEGE